MQNDIVTKIFLISMIILFSALIIYMIYGLTKWEGRFSKVVQQDINEGIKRINKNKTEYKDYCQEKGEGTFRWYESPTYHRCIIVETNSMLTVTKETYGFFKYRVWINNKLVNQGDEVSLYKAREMAEAIYTNPKP